MLSYVRGFCPNFLARFCPNFYFGCPNSLCASFAGGIVQYTAMTDQWTFLSAVIVMGIVVATGIGYFLFQDEGLTAIFFGLPPFVAIGTSLWLTRNFFTKEPQ
jgi:hypothetical protein